jgi:hypothetical protein
MNGKKILGTVLAFSGIFLLIASAASAQSIPGILHNQWFKVTASMKGYMLDYADNDNVLQKGVGSATDYMKFTYDDKTSTYTLLTCAQDDRDPGVWHKTTPTTTVLIPPPTLPDPKNRISMEAIYGALYPQIWDFAGTPIVFYDGYSAYSLYSILYTKITVDKAGILKTATISTLSCGIWADIEDLDERFNGVGSCVINGSLIPEKLVEKKVPFYCLQP